MKYLEITFIDGSQEIVDVFGTVELYRKNNEVIVSIDNEGFYYENIDIMYLNSKNSRTRFDIDDKVLTLKEGDSITCLDVCEETDMEILGFC